MAELFRDLRINDISYCFFHKKKRNHIKIGISETSPICLISLKKLNFIYLKAYRTMEKVWLTIFS